VVVAYDDSDGWYDHVTPPLVNGSTDAVNDQAALCAKPASGGYADRCGYGPRQPLLVISPFSKSNYEPGGDASAGLASTTSRPTRPRS
jgi:phospholipase C